VLFDRACMPVPLRKSPNQYVALTRSDLVKCVGWWPGIHDRIGRYESIAPASKLRRVVQLDYWNPWWLEYMAPFSRIAAELVPDVAGCLLGNDLAQVVVMSRPPSVPADHASQPLHMAELCQPVPGVPVSHQSAYQFVDSMRCSPARLDMLPEQQELLPSIVTALFEAAIMTLEPLGISVVPDTKDSWSVHPVVPDRSHYLHTGARPDDRHPRVSTHFVRLLTLHTGYSNDPVVVGRPCMLVITRILRGLDVFLMADNLSRILAKRDATNPHVGQPDVVNFLDWERTVQMEWRGPQRDYAHRTHDDVMPVAGFTLAGFVASFFRYNDQLYRQWGHLMLRSLAILVGYYTLDPMERDNPTWGFFYRPDGQTRGDGRLPVDRLIRQGVPVLNVVTPAPRHCLEKMRNAYILISQLGGYNTSVLTEGRHLRFDLECDGETQRRRRRRRGGGDDTAQRR
jgi:hypothetical protein